MPISLQIVGTGEYIPARRVYSSEYDLRWGKPEGWTKKHTGIDYRQFANESETSTMMAAVAAQNALALAGLQAQQMDLIISACSVMEQAIPCNGALIQRRLGVGMSGIPAFDINATCLSFLTALDIAAMGMACGKYRRVLIVASEVPSCGLREEDTDTAPLFGDGAGAVVLVAGAANDPSAYLGGRMETYGDGADLCQVRSGGTRHRVHKNLEEFIEGAYFQMEGKATYRMAAQLLPGYMQRLFGATGIAPEQLHKIIPHQASAKALDHLQAALKLPDDMLVRTLESRGNQLAASIPIALHHAICSATVVRGQLIALVGSGAGLSFGGAILRY
jgi:3-oxoacyl-[acyl-carrier-protein] synthase III